jgi:glycosyltransferase involved in cell wall biosynthesis
MPLKVLNLTSTPRGIGGVESLLLTAVDKYDARRFEVSFSNLFDAGGEDSVFAGELHARGARYIDVPGAGWRALPRIVAELVRVMRRERFDVVHTHMLHATIIGQMAARLAGVPVRIVSRQYMGDEAHHNKGAAVRAVDTYATRTATHVIANSEAVREILIRGYDVAPERVTVVHNSVDIAAIDAARLTAPLPWDDSRDGQLLLGYVASLTPRKDHENLFRAFARVLEAEPRARLVLVGEGPERTRLEALASELSISRDVVFAGYRDDVAAVVRHFDLYVHPPRHEAFGIAVAEALALSRPVVATAVGGIPEVVGEEAGVLVAPGDPEALASAILRVLRDPELRARLGHSGRRRVEERFDIQVTVDRYQDVYSRFAGRA